MAKMMQSFLFLRAEPKALGKGQRSEAETPTCQWHKLTYKTKTISQLKTNQNY